MTRSIVPWVLLLGGLTGCSAPGNVEPPPLPATIADPQLLLTLETAMAAVVESPEDALRWATLGAIHEANLLFDLARPCYERAVVLDPGRATTWYRLAVARRRTGDTEGGLAAIERAVSLDGSYAPLHWRRGHWLFDLGRLDEAAAAFAEATRLEPRDTAAWSGMARVELQRNNAEQAARILERLLASNPRDAYLHHLLGTAYRALGRTDEARAELERGRTSDAVWNDPWSQQIGIHAVALPSVRTAAEAAIRAGRFEVAIPMLEQLRRRHPDDREVLSRLARAYLRSGRRDAGLRLMREMLDRYPDSYNAQLDMAQAYEMTGDPERALTHADRALTLHPDYAFAHRRRGSILRSMNRLDEAVAALERATELNHDNAATLTLLGDSLSELGRRDEAADVFERAATHAPYNDYAWLRLGQLRRQTGREDEAREAFTRAAELGGRHAQAARSALAGGGADG